MGTVDLITLSVPLTYVVFLATERAWPAREFPPRRGWQWIGAGFLVLVMTVLAPSARTRGRSKPAAAATARGEPRGRDPRGAQNRESTDN